MSIEVTLNEPEKLVVRLMAILRSMRFSGLVELQVLLDGLSVSDTWLRFLLKHHFAHWFDTGFGTFLGSTGPSLSYLGDPPVLAVDASDYQRAMHDGRKRDYEEAKKARDAVEEMRDSAEKRINFLGRLGFLHIDKNPGWVLDSPLTVKEPWVKITEEGSELASKIAENRLLIVRHKSVKRKSIFVATAFGRPDTDELYEVELKPACAKVGFQAVRVDLSEPETTITEAILRGIQVAECVIADLTYARPSVYFEAGFGGGLGAPLLLTCRKDHQKGNIDSERIHFDLEQYKISFWERRADGSFLWKKEMHPKARLTALIGEQPVHPGPQGEPGD